MNMTIAKRHPDWTCDTLTTGGDGWMPEMIRFYPTPDGRRRKVKVTFVSWVGIAHDAIHTHVRLEPDRNPVWTGDHWAVLWDDPDHDTVKKLNHSQSFVSEDRALRWAVRTLDNDFPEAEWEREWPTVGYDDNDHPVPSRWDPSTIAPDAAEDAAVKPCQACGFAVGEHTDEQARQCNDVDLHCPLASTFDMHQVRVLVDAGSMSGRVGDDVLVLTDMHPSQLPLLQHARALIVECGGTTAHLATVAREMGVTVVLVADATSRYKKGADINIDTVCPAVTVR